VSTAGLRDKYVVLENPGGTVADGEGGYIEGWEPLDPSHMFASIDPASQSDLERAASGTVISTASHLIQMPYHPGVTVMTRLRLEEENRPERIFQVTSVRNLEEADRELVIVAEEQL
jgi:head-tail adaptor